MNTDFVEVTLTTVSKGLLEEVLDIYVTNAEYFKVSSGEKPSLETIIEDKNEIPPGLKLENKNYKLIKKGGLNIGVVDYLEGYPDKDTVYIGLLMIHGDYHRQGYGRAFIDRFARDMKLKGYKRLRLGVLEQNKKAFEFWTKMGFEAVKEVNSTIHPERNWKIKVMEKVI
ncbi:GNAT family N-acetyltransferase [Paratissierella segnis]|jgi:ribosomal protein S18 acetylase RimI-like enzyme|uniref:GNAT family N-acetyltransferase n=1 Tax=Paratissierella segnis TaxID=2763679 RepID=A0A926EVC0_9FIRM|nr:GNAT family N-acetyltransferase [Paratissierella segnis]MBC8586900.1 GNAT family N-acetyltransferase [Paratissierella segnis]